MHAVGPIAIQTSLHPQIGPDAIRCGGHADVGVEGVDRALDAFRDITSGG